MADTEQKNKILRYYKGTEEEAAAVKVINAAEQAARNQRFAVTGFLSPAEQDIAQAVARIFPELTMETDGGYAGAERQRAMFTDSFFQGKPGFDIICINAAWKHSFDRISHRDVLGALMSQGIQRDRIGDIIVEDCQAAIIADKKIADFLLGEFCQIKHNKVECTERDISTLPAREEKCKEIRATVASMRIDAIAAAGYGISRSKAAADIEDERLKVNWQTVTNPAKNVNTGDVVSLRGRGRLEIAEISGQTRKGRIGIVLKRYY